MCAGVRRVAAQLAAARRLRAGGAPPEALAAEPVLAELSLAHSRIQLYFNFLRKKTEVSKLYSYLLKTNKLFAISI